MHKGSVIGPRTEDALKRLPIVGEGADQGAANMVNGFFGLVECKEAHWPRLLGTLLRQ
jgi:hypothetical protein